MSKKSIRDDYDISLYQGPTYISWNNMKNRCLHKSNPKYNNYGGRGISFCLEWNKFSGFLKDMGLRPQGMTLDRIDGSKGYFKNNCRWASTSLQSSNRRSSTNTGEKYISFWANGFIVAVNPFKHKRFSSIEQAIEQRNWRVSFRAHNIKFKENSMIPETIKVTKRITTGDYEYEEVTIEAAIEKGESVEEVIAEIKETIASGLSAEKKTSQKNKHTNDAPSRKSKAQKEEADDESGDDEVEITEEKPKPKDKKTAAKKVVEETEEDDEQEEEKPKTKKKAKGASAYDRTDDTHKKLFSEKLDQKFPDWRTKKSKMAKLASSKLNGTDFLDSDGDVIPEFVAALVKLMK